MGARTCEHGWLWDLSIHRRGFPCREGAAGLQLLVQWQLCVLQSSGRLLGKGDSSSSPKIVAPLGRMPTRHAIASTFSSERFRSCSKDYARHRAQ